MPNRFTALHVYLNASNPEKSRAFYEALGFKRLTEMKEFDVVTYDAGNGATFIVGPSTGGDEAATKWLANKPWGVGVVITQEVKDVDDVFARAKNIGAEIESPPADMPWGVRMMALADPDGYAVWFQQMLAPTRAAKGAKRAGAKRGAKTATRKAGAAKGAKPAKKAKKAARRGRK